jgi:hypothetical protein
MGVALIVASGLFATMLSAGADTGAVPDQETRRRLAAEKCRVGKSDRYP